MSIFKSKSVILCSLIGGLAVLSGCSDNDPADVSFEQIDTTGVPANIIPNADLSQSDSEWTGWSAEVDETDGAVSASFDLAPTLGEGGNSLQTSVANVEVEAEPGDIYAGPSAVTVKPGQAYGVAAYVQGPTCGLTRFIVNPEGNTNPENYLAEQNIFLTGEPQMVEFYFQVPDDVNTVDMPVQMGFADNVGGEFFFDRMVAMPIPVMPQIEEGNEARNSDFEQSDTSISVEDSWGQSGTGVTFSLNTDPDHVQNGNNSVKIVFDGSVGDGDPWAIEAGPAGVPVTSGWTYVFSGWVKGTPGAKANFIVQKPAADWDTYGQQEVTVTSEWQEVRFEAVVSGTDEVRLFAQYNFPENKEATIYIDNLKLIPPDTCPYAGTLPNLISTNEALFEYNHVVNGGFEDDLMETLGWATTENNGSAAQFEMQIVGDELNRTLVNTGYQSLKTTIAQVTNNPTDIQVGPADLYVVPGQTYIYSGFVRGPVGAGASLTTTLPDSPSTSMEGVSVPFNNLWQQVTFDFTVPDMVPVLTPEELAEAGFAEDEVLTRLNMVANLGYPENEGKHIYLDDFVLLPNAIRNGDLEDSAATAQGWTMASASDYATMALDTTVAHLGTNSLRTDFNVSAADTVERPEDEPEEEAEPPVFIISPDDVWAGVENIPVAGGRRYFVSARVNGEAGSLVKLAVTSADGSRELASAGNADENEDGIPDGVELGGGWQEITFAVNVPSGMESVNLIAQMGYPTNALRTIYLDTFRLVSQIPPAEARAANVISNSDFETGATTGWAGSDATITVVSSPEGVYSGRYGLYVSARTQPWGSAQFDLENSALTIGETYFAFAWVKVNGVDPDVVRMTLRVDYVEGGTDYLPIASSGEANTLNWTRLSSVFTFTPTVAHNGKTVASLTPYIETDNQATNYFIDDVFITKVLNANGGFEAGMNGWNAAGATVVATDTDAHSGSSSAYVSNRSDGWSSVQYDLRDIGLVPGRTYLLSAWVKRDGDAPENIKMTIEQQDDGGDTNRWRTIAQSSDTTEWVQLSNTYTYIPNGDVATLKVYFEAEGPGETGGGGAYFVDDLVITEFVPPPSIITNGGLEQGTTTGWIGNGATIALVQWPQGGAQMGFFGLQVSGRSQNWHSPQYPLLPLELEANTSYKASVWVKIASETATTETMNLTLLFNDGRANPYINLASATVNSSGWTQLVGFFDYVPTGDVTDLRLYVEAAGATTSFYVDELVVAPNYVVNGGLEASTTNHLGWNGSGAVISLNSDAKYSGERSLFVTGRAALWNSAQYDLRNSGMEPGKTYDISAWVKIDGDTPSIIKMTMESAITGNNDSIYTQLDASRDTSDWVKLSRRYTVGFDEIPAIFRVYFEADEQDEEGNDPPDFSAFYVDSLVITEVEETYTH